MPAIDAHTRSIIVVEDLAHLTYAHTPNRFAEIAEALERSGCRVAVLTATGWSRAHEPDSPPLLILRYEGAALVLHRITRLLRPSEKARGSRTSSRQSQPLTLVRATRRALASVAVVMAVSRVRRDPTWSTADVFSLSVDVDPRVVASVTPRGRWLITCFRSPELQGPTRALTSAQRITLSTPSEDIARAWQQRLPDADVRVLPLAGVRTVTPTPNAREMLGLDPRWQLALLFGTEHPERDSQVVLDAIRLNPRWHLLVAGQLASSLTLPNESWVRERVHVLAGPISNAQRTVCYAAADVAVLSFVAGYQRNSGTLMDAVSHGTPVACSNHSFAATLVRDYQRGSVFEPGNPHDLARALDDARSLADTDGLERLRADYSNDAVARAILSAFAPAINHDKIRE